MREVKGYFLSLFLFFALMQATYSQCLWIKRILVDACVPGGGCTNSLSPACSCEGKNEMLLLRTGTQSISISNMIFDWPNNNFLGIVFPNATTSAIVNSLQASVMGCGKLLEPIGGILPPNRDVLFILSTDMCVTANSFANLQDTLYVIFQNPGNFQGHYANANATSSLTPRITNFTVTGSPSCTGSVSYIPGYLTSTAGISYSVNQSYSSNLFDGGAVEYDIAGNPTYTNIGCNAPYTPMQVSVAISSNTLCASSVVTLTANVLNGTYNQITWSGGQGTFAANVTTNNINQYTPGINEFGPVTLTCVATRTCGSITGSAQTVFTLNVYKTPTVSIPPSYTACSGQTITLQPTITPASQTGPQTYSWSNGPTASSIQVSTGGTFVFTVQGICGSAQATTQVQFTPLTTLQINAPPGPYCNQTTLTAVGNGTSFVWNGTTNASSIVVNQSGSYSVSSSVGCNTATASVNVTVNVSPTVQLSPLISLCSGQSAVLQPTITPVSQTGPQTYLWSNASTQNSISVNSGGIYGFTVNAPCGSAQATTQVNLTPLTTVQISAPNPPFCYQTTLTAIGNGTSYTWNGSVNAPSLLVTQSGSYTLSGFGPCNTATASLNVSITPILTLNVNPASTFVCKPYIPFSFTAQSNANTVWQNSINASVFTPTASGNYSVTASNACGQSTAVVTFSIYNVLASFTASPINGQAPLNVNLTNSSSGAVSYTWNFGNGQTSNATNPSVTFQMPGTYTLILIAGNDSCTDTAKIEIKVLDIFGPIPELVTPNDDGKNDYWEIKGILVHKNSEVEIYNRWGNLVYRKVPYKNEWNGQHDVGSGIKGRLPSGSYFYILKLNDADNRIFKGHVRLEY